MDHAETLARRLRDRLGVRAGVRDRGFRRSVEICLSGLHALRAADRTLAARRDLSRAGRGRRLHRGTVTRAAD
jgi:hypothetical protein